MSVHQEDSSGSTSATTEMCAYCFDSLLNHFKKSHPVRSPSFEDAEFPLFITWYKYPTTTFNSEKSGKLRGCIGTFTPQNLHSGLKEYALISALRDRRFSPITLRETPYLECSVSLLINFEEAKDIYDWEIDTHGIWIEFRDHRNVKRNATYLPEVCGDQGWDKEECLLSLYAKAGYEVDEISESLMMRTTLTRYQSSKCVLTYKDYVEALDAKNNNNSSSSSSTKENNMKYDHNALNI